MILEYTLSAAAVARGCTSYVATLFGLQPTDLLLVMGALEVDFFALGLVIALCSLLAYSTRESSLFNAIVTGADSFADVAVKHGTLSFTLWP